MLACLRILNHTPQEDGCSIQQYYPKLWASVWRICAQLVVWDNLWSQIFHRSKIDARGSIRKALNAISWTMSLTKLRIVGEKDAGAIIKAWNASASRQQRIEGAFSSAQTCAGDYAVRASGGERAWQGEMPLARRRILQQAHPRGWRTACLQRYVGNNA